MGWVCIISIRKGGGVTVVTGFTSVMVESAPADYLSALYTVCANELASSHGQSSPFALLKITFTAFAQLIQAHKKWELHRCCPLLLLLLWGLCRHGRQSEDPNAACSSYPLYCLLLPYISIWKVSQVPNSCLAKKKARSCLPPPHPPTPIYRPHRRSLLALSGQ